MTPILATLVILANGFTVQVEESDCFLQYQRMNENQINIYYCGEIHHYIYKNQRFEP